MKYIHIYNTKADFKAAEKETYDMSLIRNEDNHVIFYRNYSKEYFTIKITKAGTFTIHPAIDPKGSITSISSENILTISYSLNGGEWISAQIVNTGFTLNVSLHDEIRFKGTNTNYCYNQGTDPHRNGHVIFGCIKDSSIKYKNNSYTATTAEFIAYGNIMSLCYGDNFVGQTTLPATYTFCSLFKTSTIISAKNLILPATTLVDSCYRAMFSKAKKLIESPVLSAKDLVIQCYKYMFEDCISLQKITCLAETGMTTADADGSIASFTAASNGVTLQSTGIFVKSENASWTNGKNGIPNGWTVENYSE